VVQYECIQEQKLGQAGIPMRVPEFPFSPPNSGKKTQMKRRFAINTWPTCLSHKVSWFCVQAGCKLISRFSFLSSLVYLGIQPTYIALLYLLSCTHATHTAVVWGFGKEEETKRPPRPTILQLLGCVPRQLSRAHFRVKMLSGCIMSHGKCHRRFCTFSFVDR
jgi:hypothetical protein